MCWFKFRSFYALSKTHHPDANPSDPNASATFSLISESYHILADASRRTKYDRDVLHLDQRSASGSAHPRGSYSSTNPAGGRAPSGLSRRRGTFRGPPPSFYRSGGWGTQADKRKRAHEESTGTGESGSSSTGSETKSRRGYDPWDAAQSRAGGMGPGDSPYGHSEDVPHFDKEGHTRTHKRQDQRRWQRAQRAMGDDNVEFEPQMSISAHFLVVSAILAVTVVTPMIYLNIVSSGRKKDDNR